MSYRLTHRQPDGSIFSMRFLFPDDPGLCQVDKNLTRTGPNLLRSCALWLGRCIKVLAGKSDDLSSILGVCGRREPSPRGCSLTSYASYV